MTKRTPVAEITRAHAKLSASGSEKWMTCTPSAHIEDQYQDEGSVFAEEGTFAHAVFEQELLTYLNRPVEVLPANLKAKYDSQELRDHVWTAVNYAIERIEAARERCKDPIILVEQRLDFSLWVPEGFGTGDLVIITDGLVEVLDYKHGKGVFVDALNNSQMRLYGLGAYNQLAHLYDITMVRMTVLQPRLNNFGSEEMSADDLLQWAQFQVVPRAKLAWEGKGEFVAGEHCTSCFCKARYTCPARAEAALALAKIEFGDDLEQAQPPLPQSLSVERIAQLLPKADMVIDWFKDLKDFALKQAEQGVTIPGHKLVEGRSNRKYDDQAKVAAALTAAGIDEAVIYERSLLGITAMEKAIGKKVFAEVLDGLIVKPSGKPTLVPESDKRPALSSAASAADDFS
jgi:hypothetical protein